MLRYIIINNIRRLFIYFIHWKAISIPRAWVYREMLSPSHVDRWTKLDEKSHFFPRFWRILASMCWINSDINYRKHKLRSNIKKNLFFYPHVQILKYPILSGS
jgi:hypothetical protein